MNFVPLDRHGPQKFFLMTSTFQTRFNHINDPILLELFIVTVLINASLLVFLVSEQPELRPLSKAVEAGPYWSSNAITLTQAAKSQ